MWLESRATLCLITWFVRTKPRDALQCSFQNGVNPACTWLLTTKSWLTADGLRRSPRKHSISDMYILSDAPRISSHCSEWLWRLFTEGLMISRSTWTWAWWSVHCIMIWRELMYLPVIVYIHEDNDLEILDPLFRSDMLALALLTTRCWRPHCWWIVRTYNLTHGLEPGRSFPNTSMMAIWWYRSKWAQWLSWDRLLPDL